MRALCGGMVMAVVLAGCGVAQEPVLVEDGASEYVIVVSKEASGSERWAARDLSEHIKQMSGAALPVQDEEGAAPAKAILIGDGPAARALGVKVDAERLGPDGFVVRTVGSRLVIAGGRQRGTMYGVYEVLSGLGCRWWAPGESTIPRMRTIRLSALDMEKVPVLEYRDVLYGDLWLGRKDSEDAKQRALWYEGRKWCARNRLHARFHEMPGADATDEMDLGPIEMDQAIAHGVLRFIPLETYKESHPEYYALSKGNRVLGNTQPCWSNEEIVKIAAANAIRMLDEHPTWRVLTLGQEDFGVVCECESCKALVEKHGSNSGMVIHFINEVAALVKEKHPEVWINTNAYRWSQKAPTGIRCADNVMITIPPIACNYAQPLAEGWPQENADYKKDLEDWAKICDKIYVWDYTTNFVHYVMPFPNMYVLQPNIKFFVDHNVRGVFEQGSHTTDNGQFSKLVMWVSAQSMWHPESDGAKLVEEFCLGYYGPQAGPLVLEYIKLMRDRVVQERIPIWATHRTKLSAPHLTAEIIARGEQLFRRAEEAVKDDAALVRRVEVAHFPVQYMLLRRAYAYWDAAKKLCPAMTWRSVAEQFARVGRENGIKRVAEGDSAEPLYQWAVEYAAIKEKDAKGGVPEELKSADPTTYALIEAAQFDRQVKFLRKSEGATDGWAVEIPGVGWSITNELGAGKDFTAGKTYKVFMRARGKAAEGATGPALGMGIHHPQRKRVSGTMSAEQMDGQWHTVEVCTWQPDEAGGTIYIALIRQNVDKVSNVVVDCVWLLEAGDGQ